MRLLVTWLFVSLSLAGCTSSTPDTVESPTNFENIPLDCYGRHGIPSLESSYLGSCWGHIGHHTYFLDPPRTITEVKGALFAVEVEETTLLDDPVVFMQTSLDGRNWITHDEIDYPLGTGDGRHSLEVDWTGVADVRFIRFHMPRSVHEGLAGYLDMSRVNLSATNTLDVPWPTPLYNCRGLLETFFDDHPCWFGGYDQLDDGKPDTHVAAAETHESWYDSPSFIHTYLIPQPAPETLYVSAEAELWRAAHAATCPARGPFAGMPNPRVTIFAQTSADGITWDSLGEAKGSYGDRLDMELTLHPNTRFLRFGSQEQSAYNQGPCHHPTAFMVFSGLAEA